MTKSVSVGRPITMQVVVEHPGPGLGQALATVAGTQDGLHVCHPSPFFAPSAL